MTNPNSVSEGCVLIATTKYLLTERKVLPYQFSVASGRGVDYESPKAEIEALFQTTGRAPTFVGSGPDIIAVSDKEWWCVECKGVGGGKPATQRNNFDRALSSVVSYYEVGPQVPAQWDDWTKDSKVFLGLALPASEQYLRLLERRVRPSLRRRLNLWVLLYEQSRIRALAPAESL